jgi:type II secretory pathway component PulJ
MVELLVAAAIGSMVMGAAMGIWSYARRNISRPTTRQVLQMDAQKILVHLRADLKAAKAETFKASENPLTLEFKRYVVSKEDNTKLSAEQTEDVKYVFNKPILHRTVGGQGTKKLSANVENIRINRKAISEEQKEKEAYLESRVDIALDLKSIAPGTDIEEKYSQHTSVVIRDEFYTLTNKEREEVLVIAKDVAEEIKTEADSSFFNDVLNADALKSLTEDQLVDLDETQKGTIEEAKNSLKERDDRISNVDTGKKWWQVSFIGFLANEEGADVKKMRNDLEKISCPDKDLPSVESKTRPSDKADEILKQLEDKIGTLEKDFFDKSFKDQTTYDQNSEDPEVKRKAAAQKRAYDMKLLDRQIEKAVEKMSEEEKKEAEEAGTIPKSKMIDQVMRTEADIRKELETSQVVDAGSAEFEAMVARELADQEFLKSQYDNCKLEWMDDGGEDENKLKAYEAAKQLKTLAESKKETLKLKELAIDNRTEIAKAQEAKKESFEN